jgi:YVTN family beta-propeller protein
MEFRILGPIEVVEDGERLPLGGTKQRALLALLVLNADRVVASDRLIDALWGESAPDGATHTLQVYISQLRKALRMPASTASGDVLLTEGRGYVLHTREVDLYRFEETVESGRRALADGSPDEAAGLLRQALDLWRGPTLADLAFEHFAQPEIARIEERRLLATEDRIDADLALGRHAELVGELRGLTSEHPLRERLWGQLILAQYRSGRQAEALQAYQEARRMLADDLGIDPSQDLRRLEGAILRQDPELDLPRPESVPAEGAEPRVEVIGSPKPRRIGPAVAVAVVAAAIGLTVAAIAILGGSGGEATVSAGANSVARVDPGANELVASMTTTGTGPTALVWYQGSLWVANTVSRTVARIDPATNAVVRTIPTGGAPTALAAGLGAVWVLNGLDGSLAAIDPRTEEIRAAFDVPIGAGGVAVASSTVWVTDGLSARVVRINPTTGEVVGTIDLGVGGSVRPEAIAAGAGTIWVGDGMGRTVWEIDIETGQVVASPGLRATPSQIAVDENGTAWVTGFAADIVSFIDPDTLRATTVSVGRGPIGVAVGEGSIWVANSLDGSVSRIDRASNEVSSIAVAVGADDVAVGGGGVWVSVNA